LLKEQVRVQLKKGDEAPRCYKNCDICVIKRRAHVEQMTEEAEDA
jgi:hypothetical protein